MTKAAWKELKKLAGQELSGKKLYVVDTFCGANENSRLKIRFIMEVAWQAHFVKNMFIRPTDAELEQYGEPDFVVLNASKAKVKNYKKLGLNSETAVVFNLTEKMQVIINTWYGGEMKKGMFSYMNYLLPLKGIASMHCSANTNEKGETAIFFGLSGTGQDDPLDRSRNVSSSATTSTAGTTTAYSTSRAAAMPRSSISRKRTSPTSGTLSAATRCWRT